MWTLWTVLLLSCSAEVWTACNSTFSVPVPGAQLLDDGRLLDVQENVTYEQSDFWFNGSDYLACPCNRHTCLFKCCPPEEEMNVAEEEMNVTEEVTCLPARNQPIPSNIQLLHHNPCSGPGFRLPAANFTVTQEGKLVFDEGESVMEAYTFCVDTELDGSIVALVCTDSEFSRISNGISQPIVVPIFVIFFAIFAISYVAVFNNNIEKRLLVLR